MEWYDIIIAMVGGLGGVGGIISLYQAKSNKDTIDISNLHSMIEEERTERKNLSQEYHDYKSLVEIRVGNMQKEFDDLKKENQNMIKSIYQAYRCKLPEKLHECPVIKAFNNDCKCDECTGQDAIEQ